MCVLILLSACVALSSQPHSSDGFRAAAPARTRPKVGALTFHPLARHLIRTHTTLLLPFCHVVRPSAPPRHHSLSPTSRCAELAIFSKSPINTAKRWESIVEHAESSRLKACDAGSFRSFVVLLRAGCRNVQGVGQIGLFVEAASVSWRTRIHRNARLLARAKVLSVRRQIVLTSS